MPDGTVQGCPRAVRVHLGAVGVLHGLLEAVGVLLEAAEIVLGGCQGATGAVRMMLGGVGGC